VRAISYKSKRARLTAGKREMGKRELAQARARIHGGWQA